MKTSNVRKRLVSPWIVGKPAFVFLFHIIKEGYTARMLHFWNPPSPFVQGKGASVPRVLHLGMSCPPRAFLFKARGAFAQVRIAYLPPGGSIYQLTPYQKDSELVDSQEPVDADYKFLICIPQSKRTVWTNRNGFTGFAFLREFPKGTTRF